jgi:hypothetical protein
LQSRREPNRLSKPERPQPQPSWLPHESQLAGAVWQFAVACVPTAQQSGPLKQQDVAQHPVNEPAIVNTMTKRANDLMFCSLYLDWAGPFPLPRMEAETGSKAALIERGISRSIQALIFRGERPLASTSVIQKEKINSPPF